MSRRRSWVLDFGLLFFLVTVAAWGCVWLAQLGHEARIDLVSVSKQALFGVGILAILVSLVLAVPNRKRG